MPYLRIYYDTDDYISDPIFLMAMVLLFYFAFSSNLSFNFSILFDVLLLITIALCVFGGYQLYHSIFPRADAVNSDGTRFPEFPYFIGLLVMFGFIIFTGLFFLLGELLWYILIFLVIGLIVLWFIGSRPLMFLGGLIVGFIICSNLTIYDASFFGFESAVVLDVTSKGLIAAGVIASLFGILYVVGTKSPYRQTYSYISLFSGIVFIVLVVIILINSYNFSVA